MFSLEEFTGFIKADHVNILLEIRFERMDIFSALEIGNTFVLDSLAQHIPHDSCFSACR